MKLNTFNLYKFLLNYICQIFAVNLLVVKIKFAQIINYMIAMICSTLSMADSFADSVLGVSEMEGWKECRKKG